MISKISNYSDFRSFSDELPILSRACTLSVPASDPQALVSSKQTEQFLSQCFAYSNLSPEDPAEQELVHAQLSVGIDELFESETEILHDLFHSVLSDQATSRRSNSEQPESVSGNDGWTDKMLWERIQKAIGSIESTYLDSYQNALAKMVSFLNSFNNDVYSNFASWVKVKPDGKDNELIFEGATAYRALNNFLEKYAANKAYEIPYSVVGMNPAGILWPSVEEYTGSTEEEFKEWTASLGTADKNTAIQWASDLGVPESCVVTVTPVLSPVTWVVSVDLQHVQNMRDGLVKNGWTNDNITISNVTYQAFNTAFTSSFSNQKAFIEALTEKNRNGKATFDNLSNVLSSTISSCMDTDKHFLTI
ncbi:TPA: IpaD/SipD/SspD family type III secretion system needle tip protein [Salmonella enterica]|nr:hypothetical protein [Salmonella enterica subsp. diarizonae]HEA0263518.1 IpaD/SipD/SspD family type III secretion system needle tip protein [Salmonella enterica]HEA0268613.1 IpaD/SipD/SspD family type III secretion system needle tip protein [Salmonella enterica]HEA0295550.1 IpaD/SipD/SspD family type III secretion system needle tip protein [Salmonella enterica]HEA0304659.1 IpaD/SipD/SspD family type III secretion system needle tip protein [Salmonella enterica]